MKAPFRALAFPAMTTALALSGCTPISAENRPAAATSAPASAHFASNQNAELASFFDKFDQAHLSISPEAKAYRGIVDADYGKWDVIGEEASIADHALLQASAKSLESSFNPASLSKEDRLSLAIFAADAAQSDLMFPFRNHSYIFNQMRGLQSSLPAFLINIHRISDAAGATAYIERIRGIGPLLDAARHISSERQQAGIAPPKWVYPHVISDIDNLLKDDNAILQDFSAKLGTLSLSGAEKTALMGQAKAAWQESAAPAYQQLKAEMQRQEKLASSDDGVWRLPNGQQYYAALLKNFTTTDYSAAQIHALGLAEVARIHGEMEAIKQKVGFQGSLAEFFVHLREDPKYYHTDRTAYLADVDQYMKAMSAKLPQYFHTLPKADLIVKAVEPFREKSAGKAFYSSPSPDGSRPGIYYVNLYNLRDMPKTELEALAYHEGLPGHHLQRAVQTELTNLPAFRRFGGFTAYTEGWGLYSEELGKDMGFYTDPYSDFGRLAMELWRACRLVVDTGIHDQRWSREAAMTYLKENTPNPDGDIEKAIERYIVYPGQATAYLIGKIKIMQLREQAKAHQGNRFNIRDFHEVVLQAGPLPLNILDQEVSAWSAAVQNE